jgi:hypothetical protein
MTKDLPIQPKLLSVEKDDEENILHLHPADNIKQ